ncbi:acyl-CoA carboxylase subunit beta [Cumulibacter soli]|uniref:acyl-CoA carboxylase subunit beta n=1 Tax=Cumulibacter soli TaxID=2546344 RepID=UPI001068D08D|nr:carboxyl transferase domain-containing protein [Cumulibacter soli]
MEARTHDPIDEIRLRRSFAEQMGGEQQVQRQHDNGRLTARERIAILADPGTFAETGYLGGQGTYVDGQLVAFTPKGEVIGSCEVDGRLVFLHAGDFTIKGGSATAADHGALGAETSVVERAREWRAPFVRLLDGAGGSVRGFLELGRTYLPDGNAFTKHDVELLQHVPVVSAILGPVAGLPAIDGVMCHFNVMVRDTAHLFPGGPPVVKAALGIDVTKEELGGAGMHTRKSGSVNNIADSEEDALRQVKRFLSYLPSSVDEVPQRSEARMPHLDAEALRELIPQNKRQPFDVRKLIDAVVDGDSFFEISPDYGRSRVTGLARVDGYPIGIMANNPKQGGGATDPAAGKKAMHLIQLCDQFHLPLVSFPDEPGFMVGTEVEQAGIERAGAELVWTTCRSRMPWITFVVRRIFGVGGQVHHRPTGMFRRYAWPSAQWGSMHISGGTAAAFKSDIANAEDPEAKRLEIEATMEAIASPFRTAEVTLQDIIDPAETRDLLVRFVHEAQRVLARQVGPPTTPFRP